MKTYSTYPSLIISFAVLFFSCGTEPVDRTIHGYVYDSVSSEPVPGVVVNVGGLIDTTSFEGYFDIGTLPSGQYELNTERICYENYIQTFEIKDGANDISINLTLVTYPVSRIYNVESIAGFTLDQIWRDPVNWYDWPEVIELDNENFEFTGRIKLGKNGWRPIEKPGTRDTKVYYFLPVNRPIGAYENDLYYINFFNNTFITYENIFGTVFNVKKSMDTDVVYVAARKSMNKH